MTGTKKMNKAKPRPTVLATYEVLAGMDGNPNTPKEFDEDPHTDGEVFFKADEDATKVCTSFFLSFAHYHTSSLPFWSSFSWGCKADRTRNAFTFEQTEC